MWILLGKAAAAAVAVVIIVVIVIIVIDFGRQTHREDGNKPGSQFCLARTPGLLQYRRGTLPKKQLRMLASHLTTFVFLIIREIQGLFSNGGKHIQLCPPPTGSQ